MCTIIAILQPMLDKTTEMTPVEMMVEIGRRMRDKAGKRGTLGIEENPAAITIHPARSSQH